MFPLGTMDLILGISWLATLGEVRSNWVEPSMKFKQGHEWVTLHRDPTLVRSALSIRSLQKLCDVDFYALLYSAKFFLSTGKTRLDLNIPQRKELTSLLQHYNSVFAEPSTLPPPRPQDHKIPLLSSALLVSVRPYRYSFN